MHFYSLNESDSSILLFEIYYYEYFCNKLPNKFMNIIKTIDESIIKEKADRCGFKRSTEPNQPEWQSNEDDMPF